jgi:hypothetical protein
MTKNAYLFEGLLIWVMVLVLWACGAFNAKVLGIFLFIFAMRIIIIVYFLRKKRKSNLQSIDSILIPSDLIRQPYKQKKPPENQEAFKS